MQSTSGDLLKNSKYYFSHENGMKVQDHLLQTCSQSKHKSPTDVKKKLHPTEKS